MGSGRRGHPLAPWRKSRKCATTIRPPPGSAPSSSDLGDFHLPAGPLGFSRRPRALRRAKSAQARLSPRDTVQANGDRVPGISRDRDRDRDRDAKCLRSHPTTWRPGGESPESLCSPGTSPCRTLPCCSLSGRPSPPPDQEDAAIACRAGEKSPFSAREVGCPSPAQFQAGDSPIGRVPLRANVKASWLPWEAAPHWDAGTCSFTTVAEKTDWAELPKRLSGGRAKCARLFGSCECRTLPCLRTLLISGHTILPRCSLP